MESWRLYPILLKIKGYGISLPISAWRIRWALAGSASDELSRQENAVPNLLVFYPP